MDNDDLVKKLTDLVQLDIDAIRAYDQALENIDDKNIFATLSQFKNDHQRHVIELSDAIRELGGEPPKDSPDIKGFLITGFTAIRSMTGTTGALNAMQGNEKLTTSTYEKALSENYPPHIKELIEKNFSDEQRHLTYINQELSKVQ